jgi:hypothetical protein
MVIMWMALGWQRNSSFTLKLYSPPLMIFPSTIGLRMARVSLGLFIESVQSTCHVESSHVREARMLCKKIVQFFSLLSQTQETGARKMAITQELLSLITGLAHYLKMLIRIALSSALKLERDFDNKVAMVQFLNKLDRLVRDPDVSKATVPIAKTNGNSDKKARPYGYKSLARAVGTLVGQGEATTDLCEQCKITIEEECVRYGTSLRWHMNCLKCSSCGKGATKDRSKENGSSSDPLGLVFVKNFRIELIQSSSNKSPPKTKPGRVVCHECPGEGLNPGFEIVTRLEQYAFLLCVALNKLYAMLKQRGVVPASPGESFFLRFDRLRGSQVD